MGYLKIIFYGILAFIERNPIFCTLLLICAIVAPFVFKVFLYIILGLLLLAIVAIVVAVVRMRRMQREMQNQFRNMGGGAQNFCANGFGGQGFTGFAGFGGAGGMTLEELVRQMQAQADARQQRGGASQSGSTTAETSSSGTTRKRVSDDVGDYVDFEEVE